MAGPFLMPLLQLLRIPIAQHVLKVLGAYLPNSIKVTWRGAGASHTSQG